jgi:hypothetical protein
VPLKKEDLMKFLSRLILPTVLLLLTLGYIVEEAAAEGSNNSVEISSTSTLQSREGSRPIPLPESATVLLFGSGLAWAGMVARRHFEPKATDMKEELYKGL